MRTSATGAPERTEAGPPRSHWIAKIEPKFAFTFPNLLLSRLQGEAPDVLRGPRITLCTCQLSEQVLSRYCVWIEILSSLNDQNSAQSGLTHRRRCIGLCFWEIQGVFSSGLDGPRGSNDSSGTPPPSPNSPLCVSSFSNWLSPCGWKMACVSSRPVLSWLFQSWRKWKFCLEAPLKLEVPGKTLIGPTLSLSQLIALIGHLCSPGSALLEHPDYFRTGERWFPMNDGSGPQTMTSPRTMSHRGQPEKKKKNWERAYIHRGRSPG